MPETDPAGAVLFGEDHTSFGDLEVRSAARGTAIGLSRGRHPKGYATLDSNEDAVMAAASASRVLLAVADGHWGFDAARAALGAVHDGATGLLAIEGDPATVVRESLGLAVDAVAGALASAPGERVHSRTTLTVACVEASRAGAGGFGDSKGLLLRGGKPRPLWSPAPFLGLESRTSDAWLVPDIPCAGARMVLATDGLLDFLGRRWADRLANLSTAPPEEFVSTSIEWAFDGGAGDHIAVAVTDGVSGNG